MAASGNYAPDYEETHVHAVYDQIASHFSSTRYKAWPLVSSFLLSLAPGSVGLDIGCGNGKYFSVNPSIYILGSDRSSALVDIAASLHVAPPPSQDQSKAYLTSRDVLVADTLFLPHPKHRFDFAISVAVVHHLSTRQRRIDAIKAILQTLKLPSTNHDGSGKSSAGKTLIYVWALEQKASRRGWDEGSEQDVMVPWVTKGPKSDVASHGGTENVVEGERTFYRYYHLYCRGELQEDIEAAGGTVIDHGYEKDNWWAVASVSSLIEFSGEV